MASESFFAWFSHTYAGDGMAISFELPGELERHLRSEFKDLDETAKEAMGVELFRQGKLSHTQLASLLNISRYETDGVLKRHGAFYDISLADVLHDADVSRQARGE